MPALLTTEQVLALAPDASSARAGRALADPRKWVTLGRSAQAAWGECQGSGERPYQTQADLSGPRFKCSCPSRKLPCKHSLGLLLLFVSQPDQFKAGDAPPWVADWLAARARKAQERTEKSSRARAPEAKARSRRIAERDTKVGAGVDELALWLRDFARRGLASAQEQPPRFWDAIAARMVDAQAPGLARLLRDLSGLPASGPGWQERLAERMGQLHLLLQAYERIDSLPPDTQADVRDLVGWPQSQDEVLAQPGVRDRWLALGQRTEAEEHLRVQRTWLWGQGSDRAALILNFAAPGQSLDAGLLPGFELDAELVFFPGAYPLRGLIRQRHGAQALSRWVGYADLDEAHAAYSAALTRHPWIERFPVPVRDVIPVRAEDGWWLQDGDTRAWPCSPRFDGGWRLFAVSGGRPIGVFAEWDGHHLLPLSVWEERRLVTL